MKAAPRSAARRASRRPQRRNCGFTLVEILVGVAIGLIGMLAIFRMVAVWDTHTRSATSGDDAQVAGTLAMFALERDIRGAGVGLGKAPPIALGCSVGANKSDRTPPAFNFPLVPVSIDVGAGGAPDTINVLTGDSSFFTVDETFSDGTGTTKKARRANGFREGDLVVVAANGAGTPGSADCALVQITGRDLVDTRVLTHVAAPYANFYSAASEPARFNNAGTVGLVDGSLFNLGRAPRVDRWQVDVTNASLTRREFIEFTDAVPVAGGVVNLKAEYGYDLNDDLRIANAPGNIEWLTVLPANADWTRVLAVRVALLLRSRQFEVPADRSAPAAPPTPTRPSWIKGDGTVAPFEMTNVDGGTDIFNDADVNPNNWRYYRYRVYERVIPLRNVIWGKQPPPSPASAP